VCACVCGSHTSQVCALPHTNKGPVRGQLHKGLGHGGAAYHATMQTPLRGERIRELSVAPD